MNNNLPVQPTSFIGRKRERAELKRLLPLPSPSRQSAKKYRLITLVGPGGVGKTRLCLKIAEELGQKFQHGLCFVNLASLTDPTHLARSVLQALGLVEASNQTALLTLSRYLANRQLLLVLDNCEHLLPGCAEFAADLLKQCPGLTILATSREAFGIVEEFSFNVSPLALPPSDQEFEPGQLKTFEAVQLFCDRAKKFQSGFTLNSSNALSVARIVRLLDGLPLALELAAARLDLLSTEQIAQRLNDRFRLLNQEPLQLSTRFPTLQATLEWSYQLLETSAQKLFRRLSILAGSWSLSAAETVCAAEDLPAETILDELGQLVGKSLVIVEPHEGEYHYHFLETIRQYAQKRLLEDAPDELSLLQERHAHYYLKLAEEVAPKLVGPEQISYARLLDLASANLRAAFFWFTNSKSGDGQEKALCLAIALSSFWILRGDVVEGIGWLQNTLENSLEPPLEPDLEVKALNALAELEFVARNYARVVDIAEKNLMLVQQTGNKADLAAVLTVLGPTLIMQQNYARAKKLLQEGLQLCLELDEKNRLAYVYRMLGQLADQEGNYSEGNSWRFQSLKLYREVGNKRFLVSLLNDITRSLGFQKEHSQTARYAEEGLALSREVGYKIGTVTLLFGSGMTAFNLGKFKKALAYFIESMELCYKDDNYFTLAFSLFGLAQLALSNAQPERAARLLGATETLRARIGKDFTFVSQERPDYENVLAQIRAKLSEKAFKHNWAEGQAMILEQAIQEARRVLVTAENPTGPEAKAASKSFVINLTERELEVLRLLAEGLTNPEIAERLVLSPRTVNIHVMAVFSKLGVTSRSAATRFALENGLI